MVKHRNAFTEAAAELAMQARGRQFRDEVELRDALTSVDLSVTVAWIAMEGLGRDHEVIVGDTMAQRLTKDLGHTLLCAVAVDADRQIAEIVKDAVREQVARDLMYAANNLLDQYDPSDEEMARGVSYAREVDDPLIADRRALARLAP